jgi:hypothetical protein
MKSCGMVVKIFQFSYFYPLTTGLPYHFKFPILEKATDTGAFLLFDILKGEYENTTLSNGIKDLYTLFSTLKSIFESDMYKKFDNEMKTISVDGTLKLRTITIQPTISGVLLLLCSQAKTPYLIDAVIEAIEHKNDLPLLSWKRENLEEQLSLLDFK